ncbi:MAG: V-type ATPase subunit subunit G family protein [Euryarchaeota archaeon]|nr:V-type ATPase subunit subunit G family protein [Euryarchaeota archaeon]
MDEEKSLLQQINEKERELCKRLDMVRAESEERIAQAKEDAIKTIGKSEMEGKKAAEEYYNKEIEKITLEADNLKKTGIKEAQSAGEQGKINLPKAIEKIVESITAE